jgi:2-hydroxychromene-2-carboxylate isomerase
MSIRTVLTSAVASHFTSASEERRRRSSAELKRQRAKAPHVVEYFHQIDDPYSHLAVQALKRLQERYAIDVRAHLVGPPEDWATPEREMLASYARLDAERLAAGAGLTFSCSHPPDLDQIRTAGASLVRFISTDAFLDQAITIGEDLWAGRLSSSGEAATAFTSACLQGEAHRQSLGHFMSAMLYYGGEWYWGVDRLHYLEARLRALGALRPGPVADPIYVPPLVPKGTGVTSIQPKPVLHFYLSFRSPYTYIATSRAAALAEAYGAELRLRFVLPMVMRGMAVPPMKSRYFTLDTAREARRIGVPFGKIADPLGKPVERGYSLLPWAIAQGRGFEYCLSFMRNVWSNGIDAGSDDGMRKIIGNAGLSWATAQPLLGNEDWRRKAEANRQEMIELGLWGVPCFRLGHVAVWGQDRLWVIEDALKAMLNDPENTPHE